MKDNRAQTLIRYRQELYEDLKYALASCTESYLLLLMKTSELKKMVDWEYKTYTDNEGKVRPVLWDDATAEDIEYLEEVVRHDEICARINDVLAELDRWQTINS